MPTGWTHLTAGYELLINSKALLLWMRDAFFPAFQHDAVWEHTWIKVQGCVSRKVLGFPTYRSGLIHPHKLDSASPLFEQCCVQFFKCCSLSLSLQMNPLCLITGSFQPNRSNLLSEFSCRFGCMFFPFLQPILGLLMTSKSQNRASEIHPK